MLFNSLSFFIFFPIVVLVYFLIPKKVRYIWLLAASYYFYMCWNPVYALLIASSTLITWISGLLIGRVRKKHGLTAGEPLKKSSAAGWIVALSFVINLGILFTFKYYDFTITNLNALLGAFGVMELTSSLKLLLPVGISFYTFQALGYTVDVYRGDAEAEKNPLRYALFVSFFPQLVAGPIERSGRLLVQLRNLDRQRLFDFEKIKRGLFLMLWGLFLKVVLADRLAQYVDAVFDAYECYGSVQLMIAALFFTLQIYCDFHSYSTIAVGAALVMGFDLMDNFKAPYLAVDIKDFWRRWHISLSEWFRDYLYIPLGGNRKGTFRKYLNLLIVFLVSGLWHGADWTFVIWGGLHGVYQIIGELLMPIRRFARKIFGMKEESQGFKLYQRIATFCLVCFAFIFFRADSLDLAAGFISRMFTMWNPWCLTDGSLFTGPFTAPEFQITVLGLLLLFLTDLIRVRSDERIDVFMARQGAIFKAVVSVLLIAAIFVFGIYGPAFDSQAFIYFQF